MTMMTPRNKADSIRQACSEPRHGDGIVAVSVVEGNDDLARCDADESSEHELVGSPPMSPCRGAF